MNIANREPGREIEGDLGDAVSDVTRLPKVLIDLVCMMARSWSLVGTGCIRAFPEDSRSTRHRLCVPERSHLANSPPLRPVGVL